MWEQARDSTASLALLAAMLGTPEEASQPILLLLCKFYSLLNASTAVIELYNHVGPR